MDEFWKNTFYQPDPASGAVPKRYVLIGTPGIGKSASINYFLWRYLNTANDDKRWRYIIALLPKEREYYVFDTEKAAAARIKLVNHHVNAFADRLGEDNVLVLHDLGIDPPIISETLAAMVFTSPNMRKTHEYRKDTQTVTSHYVPVPDDNEMEYMAQYVFNGIDYGAIWSTLPQVVKSGRPINGWRDVAYFVGNVPRHVFARLANSDLLSTIESTVGALELENISNIIHEKAAELSDSVIYFVPTDNGRSHTQRLRPGWVTDQINERVRGSWGEPEGSVKVNPSLGQANGKQRRRNSPLPQCVSLSAVCVVEGV